jgi:hypothetical protein
LFILIILFIFSYQDFQFCGCNGFFVSIMRRNRFANATLRHIYRTVWRAANKGTSLLLEEHFFDTVVVCKKKFGAQFEDLPQ